MQSLSDSDSSLEFPRQPTMGDVAAVHEAINTQQKEINSIDGEIEMLMRNVRRLAHQKSQHQARIRHYKGLITLATRIAPELLAIIFEHAASDSPRAPLVLSHVCSAWRAATTLPGVWSHIFVNCDNRDPFGRTQFWLSRVQEAPLYITLEVAADGSQLEPVMNLLLRYATQWRSLTINTLFSHQANYILSRSRQSVPDLRRVDIRTDLERRDADEVEDQLVGFREAFDEFNAPRLSTVHLARELSATSDFLPQGITSLYLHLPSWSGPATLSVPSVIQLLNSLPSLRQFTMEFPTYHERTLVPPPPSTEEIPRIATAPNLEHLTLILSPDANGVLSYIQAPALLSLTLRSSGEPLGFAHIGTGASLIQFIDQSSPPLERLDLHDVDIPPADLTRCLASLDHLRELALHESEVDDDVIQRLYGPDGSCPRLDKLDLRWCGQLTGRALVELVQSRQEGMGSLMKEVAVINCSFVKENDIMDLAQLTCCRVTMKPLGDICRPKGCCSNDRYRQRLRLRHLINLSTEQRPRVNLIL